MFSLHALQPSIALAAIIGLGAACGAPEDPFTSGSARATVTGLVTDPREPPFTKPRSISLVAAAALQCRRPPTQAVTTSPTWTPTPTRSTAAAATCCAISPNPHQGRRGSELISR